MPYRPFRPRLRRRRSARVIAAAAVACGLLLVLLASPLLASPLTGAESLLDGATATGPAGAAGSRVGLRSVRWGRRALAFSPLAGDLAAVASSLHLAGHLSAVPAQALAPARINARLSLDLAAAQPPIPRSFLNISTEYWALPRWSQHLTVLERVLSLVSGPGPVVLRIGGTSSDWTFWASRGARRRVPPEWSFELTPAWLHEVRRIVDRTHARVILDLNTITATPAQAARWAARFAADLPGGRLAGFEIGNEPDLYGPSIFPDALLASRLARRLPQVITPPGYAASFAAFSRALSAAAPGVPLLGPALGEPDVYPDYITRLLASPHPGLAQISVHRYPFSACDPAPSQYWPTVRRLLSPAATTGMIHSLRFALRAARSAGLPLRLTELNSVTCGGVRGVSNSFATALWAPDALLALARAGVAAAAVHVRADAINAAFLLNDRGLYARPLLYGLVLFHRLLGSDPHLVPVRLRADRDVSLTAWAVRSGATLRLLVLDKGTRDAGVRLALPARGAATVQRLLAPSIASTGDVTLAGQHLGRDGTWRDRPVIPVLPAATRGVYRLFVPAGSAAMVTVRLNGR